MKFGGAMENLEKPSLLSFICKKMPWIDIFFGIFIPLNLLYYLMGRGKPLAAIFLSIGCGVIYVVVNYLVRKKISTLALMSALMILLNFASEFLRSHPVLFKAAEAFDNSIIGLLFLGSQMMPTPFILMFIDQKELGKMPAEIRESPYFMKTWRILNGMWGVAMLTSGMIVFTAKSIGLPHVVLIDYLLGWPLIVILFAVSYGFPFLYWAGLMKKMKIQAATLPVSENEEAEQEDVKDEKTAESLEKPVETDRNPPEKSSDNGAI